MTYSMGVSLDGYIVGPDGGFDWAVPDEDVFRFWTDETVTIDLDLSETVGWHCSIHPSMRGMLEVW